MSEFDLPAFVLGFGDSMGMFSIIGTEPSHNEQVLILNVRLVMPTEKDGFFDASELALFEAAVAEQPIESISLEWIAQIDHLELGLDGDAIGPDSESTIQIPLPPRVRGREDWEVIRAIVAAILNNLSLNVLSKLLPDAEDETEEDVAAPALLH